MRNPITTTNDYDAPPASRRVSNVRRDVDEPEAPEDEYAEDTDEPADLRAESDVSPIEVPDTQEALYAEDGAYRVDENEGEGKRAADPMDAELEADGLQIIDEEELIAEQQER